MYFKNNLEIFMITHRQQVTDMIISAKVLKWIKWSDVATERELSQEWVTAACLGQMAFNKEQAEKIGQIFGLSNEAIAWLQIVPYKGFIADQRAYWSLNLSLVWSSECLWFDH